MAYQENREIEPGTERAERLAQEHYDFMEGWIGKAFMDGFVHGYKHGKEEYKDSPPEPVLPAGLEA